MDFTKVFFMFWSKCAIAINEGHYELTLLRILERI